MEKKKKYISYRVDLREKSNSRRPRESCSSYCNTVLSISKFVFVCSASLLHALGPWMLSTLEVTAILLLYCLGTSHNLALHLPFLKYHFSYVHSLEDILGLSCTRCAILSLTYALGGQYMHRPYLYASYLLAATCFPYIVVKTILFRYQRTDAITSASIFAIAGAFCWFHVFASRRTVEWARRRYQMGLVGFGYPWTEGEEAWGLLRRPDIEEMTKMSDGGSSDGANEDLTPDSLADLDSKFVEIDGLKVHYKEACPCMPSCSGGDSSNSMLPDTLGILFVHSFGGGVFSWRHVMDQLAVQCRCRVVAFDRPGFGLTSRPVVSNGERLDNPYSVHCQAQLMLKLCAVLGLEKVVLVAHADGCLLTMRAVTIAAAEAEAAQHHDIGVHVSSQRGHQMQPMGLPPIVNASCESGSVYPPIPSHQQQSSQQQHGHGQQRMLHQECGEESEISVYVDHKSGTDSPDQALTSPLLHYQYPHGMGPAEGVGGGGGGSKSTRSGVSVGGGVGGGSCPKLSVAADGGIGSDSAVARAEGADVGLRGGGGWGERSAGSGGWGERAAPPAAVLSRSSSIAPSDRSNMSASTSQHGRNGSGGSGGGDFGRSGSGGGGGDIGRIGGGGGVEGECSPSPQCDFVLEPSADVEAEVLRQRFRGLQQRLCCFGAVPSDQYTQLSTASGAAGGGGADCDVDVKGASTSSRLSSSNGVTSKKVCLVRPLGGQGGGSGSSMQGISSSSMMVPSSASACSPQAPGCMLQQQRAYVSPRVLGIALLHPNLSGQMGPTLSRLLGRTKLGRSILRPLMRSEMGDVSNRRAWHDISKLTPEVLELYRAPLRIEGSDAALVEITRLKREDAQGDLPSYFSNARSLPSLIVTGEHDKIVPPPKAEALCWDLPKSHITVLRSCGHLSHEEAPDLLLSCLYPFCSDALMSAIPGTCTAAGGPSSYKPRVFL